MVNKTMVELKQYIGFFYKLCEDVANLDMLQSLAQASIQPKYTKPKFGEYTEVVRGRHPFLELIIDNQFVPNVIVSFYCV